MATFRKLKFKEYLEIQKTREQVGLPPLKMGFKICLRCERKFFSEDVRNQFNCDNCREDRTITAEVIENKRKCP